MANVRPHSGGAFMWVRLREEKIVEITANTAQARTTTPASRTRLRAIFGSAAGAARGGAVKCSAVRTEEAMGPRGSERIRERRCGTVRWDDPAFSRDEAPSRG